MESKRKEHFVGQKSYIKGKGLDPRARVVIKSRGPGIFPGY